MIKIETITGKIKTIIFQNEENGYTVGLLRVKTSTINGLENTTVQVVGNFFDLKYDVLLELHGVYELNNKYKKYQFTVNKYNLIMPTTTDKIIEFLTSSFITGCGKKTAEALVDAYKEKTLEKIKDINNILLIPNMTEKKAEKIHASIMNYDKASEIIVSIEEYGFSVDEAAKIYTKHKDKSLKVLENNFYSLKDIIDFKKLDSLYLNKHDKTDYSRIYHCLLETMDYISFSEGHTYYEDDKIKKQLQTLYNIELSDEVYEKIKEDLIAEQEIVIDKNKIYLKNYYDDEISIAYNLKLLSSSDSKKIVNFKEKIEFLEDMIKINYDTNQENAIKTALENNVTIISGGPGTGKTTILNGVVKMYISEHKLNAYEISEQIALIAPTGRASKKMSTATGMPASTIHRYLKWRPEDDSFEHDEFNKTTHKFVVVDEASMIDLKLFAALLKSLKSNTKLLLVGDSFQLPSVSAGQVLNNLIESELFNYIPLTKIYRQSDNSFIPDLAAQIKKQELEEEFLIKKDDYNFIKTDNNNIRYLLETVVKEAIKKNINVESMQILAPVYKGENGIDNLNIILRNIYNPSSKNKEETIYNDIIYRENDKVLQLVNDPDNNIFNGDTGYIEKIINGAKTTITINFDGNKVTLDKKNLKAIKHAYAISIHKSQGSEFEHVIMPISRDYYMMMYNKLLYTGVSRAKKSLILIGDPSVFASGIKNNRADNRNTTLKETLMRIILDN